MKFANFFTLTNPQGLVYNFISNKKVQNSQCPFLNHLEINISQYINNSLIFRKTTNGFSEVIMFLIKIILMISNFKILSSFCQVILDTMITQVFIIHLYSPSWVYTNCVRIHRGNTGKRKIEHTLNLLIVVLTQSLGNIQILHMQVSKKVKLLHFTGLSSFEKSLFFSFLYFYISQKGILYFPLLRAGLGF